MKTEIFNCEQSTLEHFFCNYCPFRTLLLSSLTHHIEELHFKNSKKKIPECFKCAKCKYNFSTYSVLCRLKHVKTNCKSNHQNVSSKTIKLKELSSEKWFSCDKCSFQVQGLPFIIEHIAVAHNNNEKWFPCTHCPFKTTMEKSLRRHLQTKHPSEKWFQCGLCYFGTTQEKKLKEHFEMKHKYKKGTEWFHCEKCTYKSKVKGLLHQHIKIEHGA